MTLDETADAAGENHHHGNGNDDRGNHDNNLVHHAHRGNDGVEREDNIEQDDLNEDCAKRNALRPRRVVIIPFQLLMNLARAFREKEESAYNENERASGYLKVAEGKEWL